MPIRRALVLGSCLLASLWSADARAADLAVEQTTFDTVTGTGTNRNGADFIQHGPLVGLGFSF